MIICRLCNKGFERSGALETHLRNDHDVSKTRYRELFESDTSVCKICNDVVLSSNVTTHIAKTHKVHPYDYYLKYEPESLQCHVCKTIIPKTKMHQRLCNNPNCRCVIYRKRDYVESIDYFKIYNPDKWLKFYNNNSDLVMNKMRYLDWFKRYLHTDKLTFLVPIFSDIGLEHSLLLDFVSRIQNEEIDLTKSSKHTCAGSPIRWELFGFDVCAASKISTYFTTNQDMYILKNGENSYLEYRKKFLTGMDTRHVPPTSKCAFHKDFWISKGLSESDAMLHIKKQNTRDLKYFVDKYGIDIGVYKYTNMIDKRKFSFSFEGFISKHGPIEGPKKYQSFIRRKTGWTETATTSKASDRFLSELNLKLLSNNICVLFEFEYLIERFCVDCYIPEFNLVIEFYGDYWHSNPLMDMIFIDEETSIQQRDCDKKRIDIISKYVDNIIIVWECAYLNKKDELLDRIVSIVSDIRNTRIELNFDKINLTERIF